MRILWLIGLLLLVGCSDHHKTLHDADGHRIEWSTLDHKWIVINYWAEWCHSCQTEVPQLNQFYKKHKNDIVVFGVNYDGLVGAPLKAAIKKFNIQFPVLVEDPKLLLGLKVTGVVPTTYLIDPQGKVNIILLGPQSQSTLEKRLHADQ